MWHLKQSTAVVLSFGAFVDKTDGVTPETGLVTALDHASTGIMISKNGGALAVRHASVTATSYDAYANYRVTLDATDTNTLGTLRVQFIETATCLPVWADCMVMPAQVWDSLYGADVLQVDQLQWLGTTVSTPTVAGVPNVNVKTWNDLATVALPLIPTTAGRTLDVAATGEAGLDFDNIKDATGAHTLTNITVPAVSAVAVLTTYTGNTVQTGDSFARIGATGSALTTLATQATASAVKTVTDALPNAGALTTIQADLDDLQTRVPAVLVSGRMDASVGAYQSGQTPLQPTTAGRTLDVAATGEAGLDFDNIKDATSAHTLSSITIPAVSAVAVLTTYTGNTVQTGDSYARLGAPAGASQAADIAAVKGDTAAVKVQTDKLTFTVANQIDANVLDWKSATAPAMTGDAFARIGAAGVSLSAIPDLAGVTTLLSRLTALRAGYLDNVNNSTLAAASFPTDPADQSLVIAATDAIAAAIAALNNLSQANIRTAVGLASANLDTQLTAIDDYIDTEVAAIKAKTDLLPASPAAVGSAMTLTSGERASVADALLTRTMTEAYAADGVAPTLAQALFAILQGLLEFAVAGTTITTKKLDKSTTAYTHTLDSASSPTSRTRAT